MDFALRPPTTLGPGRPDRGVKEDVDVKERVKTRKQEPLLYRVILLNDDYTTMEFVIQVLESVFEKSPAEAYRIMMHVHRQGRGLAGVYPWEIAIEPPGEAPSKPTNGERSGPP